MELPQEIKTRATICFFTSRERVGGGINWEFGIDVYTPLYLKKPTRTYCIAQGTLQYSKWGKNLRSNRCVCITESLCCASETNRTLLINSDKVQ